MKDRIRLYRLFAEIAAHEADKELLDMLGSVGFKGTDEDIDILAADYASVFLAAGMAEGRAAHPCESVYLSSRHIYMQEPCIEVKRSYDKYRLVLSEKYQGLMADHISAELSFAAFLLEEKLYVEYKSFMNDHILKWAENWAEDIKAVCKCEFYKNYAELFSEFLNEEKIKMADDPSCFSVRAERMADIMAELKKKYKIFAPKSIKGRGNARDTIRYAEIEDFSEIVYNARSSFSPKEIFYPISQTMFYFKDGMTEEKMIDDDREMIILMRPCDINAVKRLDNVFLNNGNADYYYGRLRDKIHIWMLECRESFENCFCVSMAANITENYEAAVRIDDICALFKIKNKDLLGYFRNEVPAYFEPEFVSANLKSAAALDIKDRQELKKLIDSPYWNKFDDECIGCGGCNTVCPTCSCFDTVDVIYDEQSMDGERKRVWSSCMLKDFTRTAGGARSRKTPGANMRFKLLHKMFDYRERFSRDTDGHNMCVGCGRCIDRCPKDISILNVLEGANEMIRKGRGDLNE